MIAAPGIRSQVAEHKPRQEQSSQEIFLDFCALLDRPPPAAVNNPDMFTFDKWVPTGLTDAESLKNLLTLYMKRAAVQQDWRRLDAPTYTARKIAGG